MKQLNAYKKVIQPNDMLVPMKVLLIIEFLQQKVQYYRLRFREALILHPILIQINRSLFITFCIPKPVQYITLISYNLYFKAFGYRFTQNINSFKSLAGKLNNRLINSKVDFRLLIASKIIIYSVVKYSNLIKRRLLYLIIRVL